MIQDIFPRVFTNEYRPRPPLDGDYVLPYDSGSVWLVESDANSDAGGGSVRGDADLRLPFFGEIKGCLPAGGGEPLFLFTVDETAFYYAAWTAARAEQSCPTGTAARAEQTAVRAAAPAQMEPTEPATPSEPACRLVKRPSGVFRGFREKWLGFAGITACHLAGWYERNRLCGKCGGPMRHSDKERMLECPVCAFPVYPGISPAVIVGVTDGGRLLLTRYANRPQTGGFALIAGFGEIGETIEDTVRREVMEEAGLRVKNLRFYKSQPWGFSSSMLFGFFCDLDGGDEITLDRTELSLAEWHARDSIARGDISISLTSEMIETFRLGREPL